ncbi:MAG TPA: SpoIIE family protein phosphatase [Aggregatilineales bacterium]|nr:SpoIIE family protein phosphatase [Anaerolineales bacterium]HRE47325.1 SpoIIE family protein phosphatase [Aggregatilineales bacterium]
MTVKPATTGGRPSPYKTAILTDRRTALRLFVVIGAIVILMGLIGVITIAPAQTITQTIQSQYSEQQRLLAGSLARSLENYFNGLANELINLSTRPAVQSMTGLRAEAQRIVNEVGERNKGALKAIVRMDSNGVPRYAYPEAYSLLVEADRPLPWTITPADAEKFIEGRGVQFARRSIGIDGATYLLVMPIVAGLNRTELIAFELDLDTYLNTNIGSADIGTSGQIWIFDRFGALIYDFRDLPAFTGGTAQFLSVTDATLIREFPTEDRLSIIVPVYTAFTEDRSGVASLVLILSRTLTEANLVVQDSLNSLFLFSLGVITFVVLFGVLVGIYLLRESARRRREEARRSTANTLLDLSRSMNSSLELNTVLGHILENLETVLPHDNASILLLNENKESVQIVAETGVDMIDNQRQNLTLKEIGAGKLVLDSSQPVIINDTLHDSRWTPLPGSPIKAWLGVPLKVRDEMVGVLNINSQEIDRFTRDDQGVAQAFADQAGVAIQNARAHELQLRAYQQELETARAIQNSLLPQDRPPIDDIQWAVRSIPARQVSGDYYQYFILPDGRFSLAVGDVSGKGIPAALLMAVIMTTLRDEILRNSSPADLMSELNTRLLPRFKQNRMNSALILSIYDPYTQLIEIASGGMLSPYVRSAGSWAEIEVSGYPLGAASTASYSPKVVKLSPGAMIIYLTDGVIEAQNRQRQIFGYDKFERLLNDLPLSATADDVADAILKAVREHLDGLDAQDDITIVIMKALEIQGEKVLP